MILVDEVAALEQKVRCTFLLHRVPLIRSRARPAYQGKQGTRPRPPSRASDPVMATCEIELRAVCARPGQTCHRHASATDHAVHGGHPSHFRARQMSKWRVDCHPCQ